MTDPLAVLSAQLRQSEARTWLVGGAVRDQLMGRPTPDYDIAIAGDAKVAAKALGRAADGHAFQLSDEFGAWRVKGRSEPWQVDITPLQGASIEQDLAVRDLTINAIACDLAAATGAAGDTAVGATATAGDNGRWIPRPDSLIDPHGGVEDIEARRLRAVSETSFSHDPLRVMRLGRFAAGLGFTADDRTNRLARAAAPQLTEIAAERVFQELRQTLCSPNAVAAVRYLSEIGATAAVLPELEALRGVEQSEYHHLDVYGHTLLALQLTLELESDPERLFPGQGQAITEFLRRPLANELTRGEALRFAALLHDIAKPQTRAVTAEGRITFYEHDVQGAVLATEILTRLRASEKLANHVAAMTRHHLRLGFLVHKRPLDRRTVYDYLHRTGTVAVDVTLLSLVDRYATLGKNHERAGELHHELARAMVADALTYDAHPPKPLLRGDRLAAGLGIEPGPILGELVAELTAATYAGEVIDAEQTLAHARAWLDAKNAGSAG